MRLKLLCKLLLSVVLLTMVLGSCNPKLERPIGIISQDSLKVILYDLHIANSLNSNRYKIKVKYKEFGQDLYQAVLKKHGIADTTLEKSLEYYSINTIELVHIYEDVVDSLNLRERIIKGDTILPSLENIEK